MNFLDGSLFPENQPPLIITAAPYAPSWMPSDFPEDIAVTMEQQIQKAVDCYNAGASVLHLLYPMIADYFQSSILHQYMHGRKLILFVIRLNAYAIKHNHFLLQLTGQKCLHF